MYDVTHHPSFIGQSVTSHTPPLVQSDFLSKVSFASNKNTRGLFLVQSESEGPHFRAVENHVILRSRQKTRFGGFGAAKEKGDHKIGPPLLSFCLLPRIPIRDRRRASSHSVQLSRVVVPVSSFRRNLRTCTLLSCESRVLHATQTLRLQAMARNLARDAEGDAKCLESDAMTQLRLDETIAVRVVPQTAGSASSDTGRSPAWSEPTDPTASESPSTRPNDVQLLDAAPVKSPSSSCALALDGMAPPAPMIPKQKKRVRFDAQPITSIWPAVSNYDRRSIVVDLSKTPFALFRKDAVLMKTGTTGDPSAPLPRPAPPAPPAEPIISNIAPRAVVVPETETTTAAAAAAAPCVDNTGNSMGDGIDASSLPDAPQSPRRRSEQTGSWDSDSSDSSCGHTDNETDFEQSDTDSNPCLEQQLVERRGSSTDGPAFYGVWKRTSSEGYEALLLSSGVPKRAVAMAARKHPVHIIDHDGTYFRLIVRNGLSKVDNTLFIGDEPRLVSFVIYEYHNVCRFQCRILFVPKSFWDSGSVIVVESLSR